jgi:protoporphyrinogen oxidase
MKIGILGAGITGLSIGKLLADKHDVEILEKSPVYGGIARTKTIKGVSYHTTGGHCFNSKHNEVLDFVFNKVMPKEQWHRIERDSVIKFNEYEVNYPIEFSIKQIFGFDNKLAFNIVKDFINTEDDSTYTNLEIWFRKKFGNTLAEKYFLPYNRKIWNKEPREMSPEWVEGKLPFPDKESFFEALMEPKSDKMPHSYFYYPNTNNQNTFIDNLAKGLKINYNTEIYSIFYNKTTNKWIVNDLYYYDKIISTLPLNVLPKLISNCPESIITSASKLKYNKVSTMLWESKPTNRTWTYLPEADTIFHRYIHIGSFFKPKKNYTITEVVGEKSYDEMVEFGNKDQFLVKPLDYHVSDHAYVVFDDNYKSNKEIITKYLDCIGIHSIGRFGEWEYYNMDICIKSAINLSSQIINNLK